MKTPNDSDTNSVNIELIKSKMIILKAALNRYDKNFTDSFDLQQLQRFLDSYMRGGKFDKVLTQKIFTLSDLDNDGKLSTEEFVKTYIQIEDEIKAHSKDILSKYHTEKDNKEKYYKSMLAHREEKLNSEGLGEDAKAYIEIADIEFLRKLNLELNSISIRMSLHDISDQTKSLNFKTSNRDKFTWHENFEL
jgi:hypothetical protein